MEGGTVVLLFLCDLLCQQSLAQGIGLALQRGAVGGLGQGGNAPVDGLGRSAASNRVVSRV